jgi:uncharacterized Zn finger protein
MSKIQFQVQGSSADPYEVTFERRGADLIAFCTCPAGENGQHCKHRLRIMAGESTGIVSGNENQVVEVVSWFKGSKLETIVVELEAKEKAAEKLKIEISGLKKKLATSMKSAA